MPHTDFPSKEPATEGIASNGCCGSPTAFMAERTSLRLPLSQWLSNMRVLALGSSCLMRGFFQFWPRDAPSISMVKTFSDLPSMRLFLPSPSFFLSFHRYHTCIVVWRLHSSPASSSLSFVGVFPNKSHSYLILPWCLLLRGSLGIQVQVLTFIYKFKVWFWVNNYFFASVYSFAKISSTYFLWLMWGLNEFQYVKHLEAWLA